MASRIEDENRRFDGDDKVLSPLDCYALLKINVSSDTAGEAFQRSVDRYNIIRCLQFNLRTQTVGLRRFTAWCKKRDRSGHVRCSFIFAFDKQGVDKGLQPNHRANAVVNGGRFINITFDNIGDGDSTNQQWKDRYGSNYFFGDIFILTHPQGPSPDILLFERDPIHSILANCSTDGEPTGGELSPWYDPQSVFNKETGEWERLSYIFTSTGELSVKDKPFTDTLVRWLPYSMIDVYLTRGKETSVWYCRVWKDRKLLPIFKTPVHFDGCFVLMIESERHANVWGERMFLSVPNSMKPLLWESCHSNIMNSFVSKHFFHSDARSRLKQINSILIDVLTFADKAKCDICHINNASGLECFWKCKEELNDKKHIVTLVDDWLHCNNNECTHRARYNTKKDSPLELNESNKCDLNFEVTFTQMINVSDPDSIPYGEIQREMKKIDKRCHSYRLDHPDCVLPTMAEVKVVVPVNFSVGTVQARIPFYLVNQMDRHLRIPSDWNFKDAKYNGCLTSVVEDEHKESIDGMCIIMQIAMSQIIKERNIFCQICESKPAARAWIISGYVNRFDGRLGYINCPVQETFTCGLLDCDAAGAERMNSLAREKVLKECNPKYCTMCGKEGNTHNGCDKCGYFYYCSESCRNSHIPYHSSICNVLTRAERKNKRYNRRKQKSAS